MAFNNIEFGKINFRGYEGYVVESRIKHDEQRADLFYYHLRQDDECSDPVTLEDYVLINHWGTMCFKESIEHLFTPWYGANNQKRLELQLTEEEQDQIWFAVNENELGYVKHMDI